MVWCTIHDHILGVASDFLRLRGSRSIYTVRRDSIASSSMNGAHIHLFVPARKDTAWPVVFFCHGIGGHEPSNYLELLIHIASRGHAVIYPPYAQAAAMARPEAAYAMLHKGFEQAVGEWRPYLDSTRAGFAGHSYGAGAVPSVAWHYLKRKQWGRRGAFMFIIAPWYVYYFDQEHFEQFPAHVRLLVQVYEDERFNDWRMAEDLVYSFSTIPPSNKDFVIVHNDRYKDNILEAEHVSPLSSGEDDIDAIDFYALYRMAHALAAAAFEGDAAAYRTALGNGGRDQVFMVTWPDGTPVTGLSVTDRPVTPYNSASYLFDWNRSWNKRRRHYTPVEKAQPAWLYRLRSRP